MEKGQGRLFFRARGHQFDMGVLAGIRYGLSLSEWRGELTEEQAELAARIDEARKNEDGELFSLSTDEARLAAEAIERNIKFEIRSQGTLLNSDTLAARTALPVIQEVAGVVQE